MISKKQYEENYVWIWLPNETEPVVAGKLNKVEVISSCLICDNKNFICASAHFRELT